MTQRRLMLAKSIFFDIVSSLNAPIGGHEVVTRRTVPRKMRLQKSVGPTRHNFPPRPVLHLPFVFFLDTNSHKELEEDGVDAGPWARGAAAVRTGLKRAGRADRPK